MFELMKMAKFYLMKELEQIAVAKVKRKLKGLHFGLLIVQFRTNSSRAKSFNFCLREASFKTIKSVCHQIPY